MNHQNKLPKEFLLSRYTYPWLTKDFEERTKIIREGPLKKLVESCESIFPLMFALWNAFELKDDKSQKPLLTPGLDIAIHVDYINQCYSLVAAYEGILKGLVSTSNVVLRVVLERLLRNLLVTFTRDQQLISDFESWYWPSAPLSPEEAVNYGKHYARKFSFANCRQKLYDEDQNGRLRQIYGDFSEHSHGKPRGTGHDRTLRLAVIGSRLAVMTGLSYWVVIVFLRHFKDELPFHTECQKSLLAAYDRLDQLTLPQFDDQNRVISQDPIGAIDLVPEKKKLQVTETFSSLRDLFNQGI